MATTLFVATGCKTPLASRPDAARPPDAAGADLARDLPAEAAAPDLYRRDIPADLAAAERPPDLAPPAGVPKAFRLVNHTDRFAFVDVNTSVACRRDTAAGWEDCNFFDLGCAIHCPSIPSNGDCSVECEQPVPGLVPISPGGSYVVPWNGRTYAMVIGGCTTWRCEQETVVQSAGFEASARVFADYQCGSFPCQSGPDGAIAFATPVGGSVTVATLFSVPGSVEEVVLAITALPAADAGLMPDLPAPDLPAPDLPPPDLTPASDPPPDGLAPSLAEVAGQIFSIAAAATAGDASVPFGAPCRSSDVQAVYQLAFSANGTEVSIVRVDPFQDAGTVMHGTLRQPSEGSLVYTINTGPAGAQLAVRKDSGVLTAQLALFGSGLPVLWCIDSPMMPASDAAIR